MRRFTCAVWAASALAFATPLGPSHADTPAAPAATPSGDQQQHRQQMREQWRQNRAIILDARLAGFKASLALNPDQEKNWAPFEAALRSAAASRWDWRRREGANPDGDNRPSPVDIMRRISQRLGERSAQLTALADATAPLYTSLDDKQKLIFDATLREMWRAGRHGGE
ncbi:MAG TPA: Spy/CpxP family protein refolding chaperone, partial [Roseiarcus sp.]|nr:Spy/CpxP family protein refolding chaperone [Roseiarcus sp.]